MALSEDWVPLNLQLHHDVPNQNYRVQDMGIFKFQTNLERTKHGDFTFTSWDVPFFKTGEYWKQPPSQLIAGRSELARNTWVPTMYLAFEIRFFRVNTIKLNLLM